MRWFDDLSDREFLAYHEAGHAVMAHLLGRAVHRASLRPRPGLSGHVDYERGPFPVFGATETNRPTVETDALVLLAGRAAECERVPGTKLSHAGLDRKNTLALLAAVEECQEVVEQWLPYLLVRAQAMLQRAWPLVYATARALMRDEELDGTAFDLVLAEARERAAAQEPSNCRFVISARQLSDIPPSPPRSERRFGGERRVLSFPCRDLAALSDDRQATDDDNRDVEDVLQLSARARNCLWRGGIVSIGDLSRWSIRDLRSIRALGEITLAEILSAADRIGLTLRER